MLEAMRELALIELWNALEGKRRTPPEDLAEWFRERRRNEGGSFFPFLVESPGKIDTFYTLSADPEDDQAARLEGADLGTLGSTPSAIIPFCKPSGPRSPQLGPVLKRALVKGKGPSPGTTILRSSLDAFATQAESDKPWASFFAETVNAWRRPVLRFGGEDIAREGMTALELAVEVIPETTKTVFLTYRTADGRYPGEVQPYVEYLSAILAETKYATRAALPRDGGACPLCGAEEVRVYSSALSGAGLNLANMDRPGAFPGVSLENAHLGYALCLDCADLLYVFKNTLLPRLTASIGGERALVLPHLHCDRTSIAKAVHFFEEYVASLNEGKAQTDIEARRIPRKLGDGKVVSSVDIVWATFGNKMENVRGQVLDVLPSRLTTLDKHARLFAKQELPFTPVHRVEDFRFDLNLSFLRPLFRRPGGKAAKDANASARLSGLKHALAEAVYHGTPIPKERFWDEIMTTARWYLKVAAQQDHPEIDLLHEGYSEKKKTRWLTTAGWTRHLALALAYFRSLECMEKETGTMTFEPSCEKLQPYFQEGGLNSEEKAFAFLAGVLFGRVMAIQGMKGVNVSANALTWLKRLTLSGRDLPEFLNKVREKLLAYDAETSRTVREVIRDVSVLGMKIGDEIALDQTRTCYFLMLGQAVSGEVFRRDETDASTPEEDHADMNASDKE